MMFFKELIHLKLTCSLRQIRMSPFFVFVFSSPIYIFVQSHLDFASV